MRASGWLALVATVGWASSSVGLGAQQVSYSGVLSYSAGSYIFDTRSDAFFFSNSLRVGGDRFDVSLSVPVVVQNGGVVTTVAEGVRLPTGGSESGVVAGRRSGSSIGTRGRGGGSGTVIPADSTVSFDDSFSTNVGDPTVGASAEVYRGFGAVRSVRLSGIAKIPLTDLDSGVGSGEWDYALGGTLTGGAASFLFFASGSYWWLGDLPDLELADALSYAFGVSRAAFGGDGSVLVTLSGLSRAIASAEPPVSTGVSVSHSVGSRGFLSAGVGVGLTESASSFSATLGWSIRR